MSEKFSKVMTDTNPQIKEAQDKIKKNNIQTCCSQIAENNNKKGEKILKVAREAVGDRGTLLMQ